MSLNASAPSACRFVIESSIELEWVISPIFPPLSGASFNISAPRTPGNRPLLRYSKLNFLQGVLFPHDVSSECKRGYINGVFLIAG